MDLHNFCVHNIIQFFNVIKRFLKIILILLIMSIYYVNIVM